eukprot:CCRYP_002501-RB/>CCRYP_002501-RB protein AED:0.04 eAED:0.04 QI:76/1/1/1/0.85/0.75/8/589/1746
MVGFGSSLRMSRRRGWEDAYLDYASLRLLLTQIEAVYEEEDWKRGGNNSNNLSGIDSIGEQFEHEEFGWLNRPVDEDDDGDDANSRGVIGSIWKLLGRRSTAKRKRYHSMKRHKHSHQHRHHPHQKQSWSAADEDESELDSNWVVSNMNSRSPRRNKKDRAINAMDKRGWRSPGVTDYRDELFLVSDDDIAFGCGDGQYDDDWEDADDEDDESDLHDEYEKIRADDSSEYEHATYDKNHDEERNLGRPLAEQHKIHSENSMSSTDHRFDEGGEEAIEQLRRDSPLAAALQTPNLDNSPSPIDSDNSDVVVTKYETFATVAARRGVTNTEIGPGSPEQRGWLEFIPNFLVRKSKPATDSRQQSDADQGKNPSKRKDNGETSPALGFAESLNPSEHQHHPPIFQEYDASALDSASLKFRYDRHRTPLFAGSGHDHTAPGSLISQQFHYKAVTATALGASMPQTPPVSLSPVVENSTTAGKKSSDVQGSAFGVSLNSSLIPSSEATGLLTSSSFNVYGQQNPVLTPTRENRSGRNRSTSAVSQFQFYSFQNNEQLEEHDDTHEKQVPDTDVKRNTNMISYYNDAYFSVRSPTKLHRNEHKQRKSDEMKHLRVPSLTTAPKQKSHRIESSGNFIANLLLGKAETSSLIGQEVSQRNATGASSRRKRKSNTRSKRERMRKKRQLQRRRELVPDNIRVAHIRASAITERFRGLLRAEVEKIILFANTRLGELSDTIGSLRYSSYEEGNHDVRRRFPNLDDGGMHPYSSSEDEEGDEVSCASSSDDGSQQVQTNFDQGNRANTRHQRYQSDSSNEKEAATKRQLLMRDRHRITKPLFQKAGFLGEDFSLLSAVDEADAYTAIGVELLHLLKFVCVNIIAVSSNRMLGDYYHRQMKQSFHSNVRPKSARHNIYSEHIQDQPQYGNLLSKAAGLESTGGYILGIFDTKIQEIANSTTMQTVSSSLAVALAEFEASQSRSTQLRLDHELGNAECKSRLDETPIAPEIPSPRHSPFTTKRLRDAVSYQIGGHCFRADDESSVTTPDEGEVDEHAKDLSLTRLQYVVTSVFGLREAARNRSTSFECFASRLFMTSIGPNILGDGLNGSARDTLDFLCSYNPDKAYTLPADSMNSSLKFGKEKAIGSVMISTLAAAADKDPSPLAIRRNTAENRGDSPPAINRENQNILMLNTVSMVLYIANYYATIPSSHVYALELDSRSSPSLLIGVANISSLISSCFHAVILSKYHSFIKRHVDLSFFRAPLIASAMFSIIGNTLYSYAAAYASFNMALLGRFLFGFGCSELLHRQLLNAALPIDSVNSEVAELVKKSLLAMAVGLLFGSLFDLRVPHEVVDSLSPTSMVENYTIANESTQPIVTASVLPPPNSSMPTVVPHATPNTTTSVEPFLPPLPIPSNSLQVNIPFGEQRIISIGYVGYTMAILWGVQLIALLFFFDVPKGSAIEHIPKHAEHYTSVPTNIEEEDMDSFDESDENVIAAEKLANVSIHGDGTFEKLQTMSRLSVNHSSKHSFAESIINVKRLIFSNVAFPTTTALLLLSKASMEVLLSSGATTMNRYFAWSGALAGLFMGAIASLILPINIFLSGERNSVERKIFKAALNSAKNGIFIMMNYEAIFFLVRNIVYKKKNWVMPAIYDEVFGIIQYILGFIIIFVSMSFLESTTQILMSKVSPRPLKRYSIDNSFVVVAVSALGRLVGDLLIVAVDFSSSMFCSDIINSLLLPLLVGFVAGEYLVRKHYFFLI